MQRLVVYLLEGWCLVAWWPCSLVAWWASAWWLVIVAQIEPMERIDVFKSKRRFTKPMMYASLVFAIIGLVFLVLAIIEGFDFTFPGGDWGAVIILLQGLLFYFTNKSTLKQSDFFIEWDEDQIHYLLLSDKKTKLIHTAEIQSVDVEMSEIKILFQDQMHKIQLSPFSYQDRKRLKSFFSSLKD